ncbi:MAG TPA: tRNA (adenosine(37)-N6)-dimethylallyltransferase MiaA [Dehalococcoidia bacterium]|nr:tRNA (adenosine(37)-N6)-dimethylallyltransferase MiaA [Dehalococcoidia bacterium]
MTCSRRLVAIVGPTATGKSDLAIRLALRFGGEIVNADPQLVYRGLDIGTAKPSREQRQLVPHHLIDIVDPDQPFTLGTFLDLAGEAMEGIWARSGIVWLTGGTGQYVWSVIEGWRVPRVPPQPALRRELEALGPDALAAELARVDPASAARIDPRNVRRIIRALEVYRVTGRPLSAWAPKAPPAMDSLVLGLWCDRDELYRRIDARVDTMIARGLEGEVRGLVERGYSCDLPALRSIGYKEMCAYLRGELTLEEAIARIKTETHRLSRHQRNWFRRSDPRIEWIDVTRSDPFDRAAAAVARRFAINAVNRTD